MTREVKKPETRKQEILDAAQSFFFQKGYENTTIQDIIDKLGIAKGTFYHYFESKAHMLDALTDRTTDEMAAQFRAIAESEQSAIEKLNSVFRTGSAFKMANIEVFLVMLKVLYRDENIIMRTRMFRRIAQRIGPLFAQIIRQGIKEGLFNTPDPDEIGDMLIKMAQSLNERICELILDSTKTPEQLCTIIERKTRLFETVMERILGAPEESIEMLIPDDYRAMVRYLSMGIRGADAKEETWHGKPRSIEQ